MSKDGGTFADCTNEVTEIASNSGMYFLDLTSSEMNADTVAVIVKTATAGAKTTPLVFYPEETGDINVNVTAFGGTAGTFASGRPEVNTTHVGGTSQTAGDIIGDTNDIQARLPAALVSGRIDASVGAVASGAITRAGLAADTGLQSVRSNTAQAGAAGTVTLDASASATDDFYNGHLIYLTGGAGAGQARLIRDYTGATKVADITPNWVTNPDNTSTFAILPLGSVNLTAWLAAVPDALSSGKVPTDVKLWLTGTPDALSSGKLPADVKLWLAGAPNALISGRLDVNVQAMANAVIAAATFAASAIDAAAIATDAIGANEFSNAAALKVWTQQLTEAYAAKNAAPTGAQFMFMILQMLTEFAIATTTLTVKKLDQSTTAMTYTLDDAANPTSLTRAS